MVGDTTHDLRMAEAAGIASVAVTYGVHQRAELEAARPTHVAETFPEVVDRILATLPGTSPDTATHVGSLVEDMLNDRTHHIEFNGHLTNHVKHAVVALVGLGIAPERIKAYHDNYVTLTPYGCPVEPARAPQQTIDDDNWLQLLGKRQDFAAYCEFFDHREQELGMAEMLRRYLPRLLSGWVGALQHATIHLGWALDSRQPLDGHRGHRLPGLRPRRLPPRTRHRLEGVRRGAAQGLAAAHRPLLGGQPAGARRLGAEPDRRHDGRHPPRAAQVRTAAPDRPDARRGPPGSTRPLHGSTTRTPTPVGTSSATWSPSSTWRNRGTSSCCTS